MAPHMRVRLSEGLPHFILNHFRADSWVRDPSVGLSIGSGCSAGREPSFQRRHALPDTPVGLDAQQEQLVRVRTRSGHLDLPTRGRSPDDGQSDGPRTLQIVGHVPELRQRWVPLYVARWRFFLSIQCHMIEVALKHTFSWFTSWSTNCGFNYVCHHFLPPAHLEV